MNSSPINQIMFSIMAAMILMILIQEVETNKRLEKSSYSCLDKELIIDMY